MLWVILGHTFYEGKFYYRNLEKTVARIFSRWTYQIVIAGEFAVDTFFFMSGLLVTYLLLKDLYKRAPKLKKWLPMYYIHRLVRLWPAYFFAILIWWKLQPALGHGPLWMRRDDPNCDKFW